MRFLLPFFSKEPTPPPVSSPPAQKVSKILYIWGLNTFLFSFVQFVNRCGRVRKHFIQCVFTECSSKEDRKPYWWWFSQIWIIMCIILCLHITQRVMSRQEELKERARLLLEQARRDAAIKAGNKNVPHSAINATNKATSIGDVSQSGVCLCAFMALFGLISHKIRLRVEGSPSLCQSKFLRMLGSLVSSVCDCECDLCVSASLFDVDALESSTASPDCAGTVNRMTTNLFSTLMSLPQFAVHYTCSMLRMPFQTVSSFSFWLKMLWKDFEKEQRLFPNNFCSVSLMGSWMSQPECQ